MNILKLFVLLLLENQDAKYSKKF